MNQIQGKIIADSMSPQGHRITTFLCTYPRIIHGEVLTHRMFSRNSASSRAIPFEKMVKMVEEDPFIPITWQKDHKGMQGSEYFTEEDDIQGAISEWLESRDGQIANAKQLNKQGVTKQLCNRLLEPFMWHTCLITATNYSNFFELRCPQYKLIGIGGGPVRSRKEWLEKMKLSSALHPTQYPKTEEDWWKLSESSAEIHIQALAEAMWDAMNESTPKQLKSGEWHLPFSDKINDGKLAQVISPNRALIYSNINLQELRLKVCVSRCARLSYMTFDNEIDYEKDIKLHDQLLKSKHFSCFEHCAKVMTDEEYYSMVKGKFDDKYDSVGCRILTEDSYGWCNNFRGFIPYRYLVENK